MGLGVDCFCAWTSSACAQKDVERGAAACHCMALRAAWARSGFRPLHGRRCLFPESHAVCAWFSSGLHKGSSGST